MQEELKKKNDLREKVLEILLRMWAAGAVCYFVAFGTSIGEIEGNLYYYPMILSLGVGMWVFNYLVVDRIVANMLRTNVNKRGYLDTSVLYKVSKNIGMIFLNIGIIIIISFIYEVINKWFLNIGIINDNSKGILPFEPIGFGLMYGIIYFVFQSIIHLIIDIFHKRKINKQ